MFTRNLSLGIICLLLVPMIGGCSEGNGDGVVDEQGGAGTGVLPQSGTGGIVPQAGMGGTPIQGESGAGPEAGSGPTAGVVAGSGGQPVDGGSGGTGTVGESCEVAPNTTGVHIVVDISWPETIGVQAGEGKLHIWVKSKMTPGEIQADGSYRLSGESQACGTLLPPLVKTEIVGGGPTAIDIPWEAFDAPSMKITQAAGTVSSANVGASLDMDPAVTEVGVSMADPLNDPWPFDGADLLPQVVDAEGDGKPGITGVPRADAPFTLPPTDIVGALIQTGLADRLYLVTRSVVKLSGTQDTCNSASGTAEVSAFDNHVIGCRLLDGGADCNEAQISFVDVNRTVYELHEGSYQQVTVPDTATCEEVRAALPAEE